MDRVHFCPLFAFVRASRVGLTQERGRCSGSRLVVGGFENHDAVEITRRPVGARDFDAHFLGYRLESSGTLRRFADCFEPFCVNLIVAMKLAIAVIPCLYCGRASAAVCAVPSRSQILPQVGSER